jgi:hypothetical protein
MRYSKILLHYFVFSFESRVALSVIVLGMNCVRDLQLNVVHQIVECVQVHFLLLAGLTFKSELVFELK